MGAQDASSKASVGQPGAAELEYYVLTGSDSGPEVGFEEISLKRVCELGCDATRGKYDILAKSTRFAQ